MSGHEVDEDGRIFVPGDICCPASTGLFEDRFYTCPRALIQQPWVRQVLDLDRYSQHPGISLRDLLRGEPSAALLEAFDVLEVAKRDRATVKIKK